MVYDYPRIELWGIGVAGIHTCGRLPKSRSDSFEGFIQRIKELVACHEQLNGKSRTSWTAFAGG
jgi:hypothetical protein